MVTTSIAGFYRVVPGFDAGPHPAVAGAAATAARLRALATEGVDAFLDLTEDGELPSYEDELAGARYRRMPIPDGATVADGDLARVLDTIDGWRAGGRHLYVHCRAGVGRTGTVVGCWLVRHGLDGGDPLRALATLRDDPVPGTAPETEPQRLQVCGWRRGV